MGYCLAKRPHINLKDPKEFQELLESENKYLQNLLNADKKSSYVSEKENSNIYIK
jgi:hypothetical protein